MSEFVKNSAGVWKQVKAMYVKLSGTWKPVRRAYVKIDGQWKQYYANMTFQTYSLGLSQTLAPQINPGLQINNKVAQVGTRSYLVLLFDKYGNVSTSKNFDVFGDNANGNTVNSDAMAAYLNALAAQQLFAITTFDEPYTGRLTSNLTSAMYRVGATAAIFGSTTSFFYRGAYMLLGQVGQSATLEVYRGADTSASGNTGGTDAAVSCTFGIVNNAFVNVVRVL